MVGSALPDSRAFEPGSRAEPRPELELDELMDRYAVGDNAAFPELYRRLAPRLRMFLLRMCGQTTVADDLLQTTFLQIHRARGSFVKGAAVLPWSYTIARNAFLDHVRKAGDRDSDSIDDLPEPEHPVTPASSSPHRQVVGKEILDLIKEALAKLPVIHREAFILVRFEELSIAEAARVLDTSEANVKVRAFRAYEALRAILKGVR